MRVVALGVVLTLALSGCGAPPIEVTPSRPMARLDDAVELATWLPEQAERCVVVRPHRLPVRRRQLARSQGWGMRWTLTAELDVLASATAEAHRSGGELARRIYFRFGGPVADVHERVRRLPVRWLDDPCEGVECRVPVARWVDERTMEIARYEWPRRALPLDTSDCVRAARLRPEAVEIGLSTSDLGLLGASPRFGAAYPTGPVRTERTLSADRRGVTILNVMRFRTADEAERAETSPTRLARGLGSFDPRDRQVERDGPTLYLTDRRRWTDLELEREDERALIAARARGRSRSEPLPIDEVDGANLAVVRHQVRLRAAGLERQHGERRRELGEELAALLARAVARHPAELALAERLARLEIDENGRPERVISIAERVLASGLATAPELWRTLRREALARSDPDATARVLLEDRIADDPRDAARGASDLSQLIGDGVPYEWAEAGWRLSRELPSEPAPARARGSLARGGLLGALVALATLRSGGELPVPLFAITVSRRISTQALGRSGPPILVFGAPGEGAVIVGALAGPSPVAARRLSELFEGLLPSGPTSVVLELRDPASERALRLRIDGNLRGDTLQLARASTALVGVDWAQAERVLARPLAELSTALFPPPTLSLRAESEEAAAELRRDANAFAPGICELAGPYLRCRSPGHPNAFDPLLLELARGRVGVPPD